FEVAVDPFYSETNMAELRRRISDGPEHWHIHELIEADNDYTRVRLGSPTAICGRTEETSITGSR
ncbi:MAG: hypothetical protein LBL83_12735, partial [Clostridiales bacterium]|nr:hypothetical protein [Clostridiales bacterium]